MKEVEDYLNKLKAPQRAELQRVRKLIQQTEPEATECITYGMPGFKLAGKYLIAYAAFKEHLSIFPGAEAIAELDPQLSGFTTSKGTIQFTLEHPLSDELIKNVIRSRAKAIRKIAQDAR